MTQQQWYFKNYHWFSRPPFAEYASQPIRFKDHN